VHLLTIARKQPPKKRGAPVSSSASAAPKRTRQSKLAKENDITGDQENEIKEVFQLFANAHEDFPGEKEGVIPREDVRKAMVYVHHDLPLPISNIRSSNINYTLELTQLTLFIEPLACHQPTQPN
jgi:Ca2+-binding EF-hand superfamily protein